jgi:WD40 repeat protein
MGEKKFKLIFTNNDKYFFFYFPGEECVSTIPSGCDTCVTAIGSDWNSHVGGGEGVVLCGYGDGSLRLFDARLPPEAANVFSFIEHQTWVVNVEMQRGGGKHIISGSVSGDIKFWDIRGNRKSVFSFIFLFTQQYLCILKKLTDYYYFFFNIFTN